MPDHLTNNCLQCDMEFSFSVRKHHCRSLYHSSCSHCQALWQDLLFCLFPKYCPNAPWIWIFFSSGGTHQYLTHCCQRVCDKCYRKLRDADKPLEIFLANSQCCLRELPCYSINKVLANAGKVAVLPLLTREGSRLLPEKGYCLLDSRNKDDGQFLLALVSQVLIHCNVPRFQWEMVPANSILVRKGKDYLRKSSWRLLRYIDRKKNNQIFSTLISKSRVISCIWEMKASTWVWCVK